MTRERHPAAPALGVVAWAPKSVPEDDRTYKRVYVCADHLAAVHERVSRSGDNEVQFHPHPQGVGVERWCEIHSGNIDLNDEWLA
jgi:hypothetical protein